MSIKAQAAAKKPANQINRRIISECLERGYDNIGNFAEDFLDVEPHQGQRDWWDRKTNDGIIKSDAGEAALSCANRWGKSFAAGVKLLHHAFYQIRPDQYNFDTLGRPRPYKAVNVAMSLDQAMLAWNDAHRLATMAPRFRQFVVKVIGAPFPCITISNAPSGHDRILSDIWARSTAHRAKFLLGKTFNFLNYDEAAFDLDGESIMDAVLRMRMADQAGKIDLISSPNGKNWFWRFYQMGQTTDSYYFSRRGEVFENPNVSQDYIRRMMKSMSPTWVEQNIYGRFAEMATVFPAEAVMRCTVNQNYGHLLPIPMNYTVEYSTVGDGVNVEQLVEVKKSSKRFRYVVGVDLARKHDSTVAIVLQMGPPHKLVAYRELTNTSWTNIYDMVKNLAMSYGNCPVMVDSTGMGDAPLEALQKEPYNLDAEGYNFAGGSAKENLLIELQMAIQDTSVLFPHIPKLVDQLVYYEWEDKKLQTDYVMSLALANHAINEILLKESPETLESPDGMVFTVRRSASGLYVAGSDKLNIDFSPYGDDEEDEITRLAAALV